MSDDEPKKKGRIRRLGGFLSSPFKEKEVKYKIDGKTYKKDKETCDFVNVNNSNDRIPLYIFGEPCEGKKLKEVV